MLTSGKSLCSHIEITHFNTTNEPANLHVVCAVSTSQLNKINKNMSLSTDKTIYDRHYDLVAQFN